MLFDSTKIPNEIIDTVTHGPGVARQTRRTRSSPAPSLTRSTRSTSASPTPTTRDETLVALGEKFSHLDLASMKKVVEQTQFYATPQAGLDILGGDELKPSCSGW